MRDCEAAKRMRKARIGAPRRWAGALVSGLLLIGAPARADVRSGVDAWSQGDYDTAVAQWRDPAAKGDADAMFNMGQAYKLGRGVARDMDRAEDYFRRAAQKGHIRAADNYGILLFQTGRQAEAMPWLNASAERGEPRAMYILGIAAYNGDYAAKDWVRAYALMTRAAATGLSQAMTSLSAMNEAIPLQQRQMGASLAQDLEKQAEGARARDIGAADLGAAPVAPSPVVPRPVAQSPAAGKPAGPAPLERVDLPPATTAVPPAVPATPATSAAVTAGADYANPVTLRPAAPRLTEARPQPRPEAKPEARPETKPEAKPEPKPKAEPKPVPTGGTWRIQFGAFGQKGNADALWARLRTRAEVAGHPRIDLPAGAITRLLAGGYSREGAEKACAALKANGQSCIVVGN